MAVLTWMGIPGEAERWASLGFAVSDGRFAVGTVAFETGFPAVEWGFDELGDGDLGVPTRVAESAGRQDHPNLVDGIDHVVYAVPVLDDAVAAISSVLQLRLRRRAQPRGPDGPEMAFFRAGPAVIEVVAAGAGPALWGLALRSPDLDRTVDVMRSGGAPAGDPKPAVQGGRIASVWKGYVGLPLAIMEAPT